MRINARYKGKRHLVEQIQAIRRKAQYILDLKGASLNVGVTAIQNSKLAMIAEVQATGYVFSEIRTPGHPQTRIPRWLARHGWTLNPRTTFITLPARNFWAAPFVYKPDRLDAQFQNAFETELRKTYPSVDSVLTRMGLLAVSHIRDYVASDPFQPLHWFTLRQRGSATGTPLRDTGRLMQSLNFEINR